ncbi:uncharacterized protein LOC126899405 isoform X1 [Daktulosphaira vitifoliae]|uniref:uncharacterized protein LOC126899405 isoform X1 n=1 Tax=Daktulosphaira vitifoliae TaxID=58002 RepID=UPI0021AA1CE0|nr:uncharacterized protein LOC126899405 isoform X1 [Daktulosphaira vitifoliae]
MIIEIYYFNFFIIWTIQFDTDSYRTANEIDYAAYLCEIVNYILFQDENTSIQHLTDGLTENSDYTQDLGLEINNENFTRIFNAIIELLNCRYTIILEIFHENIGLIIQYCDRYYSNKQFYDFIDCNITLNDAIDDSRTLFETLYKIVNFFNNLNINYVYKNYKRKKIIIDELSFINEYIQSKRKLSILQYIDQKGNPKVEIANKDTENIKSFHDVLSTKISFTTIKNNKYNTWQNKLENDDAIEHEKYSILRLGFIHVYNKLKLFYDEAFKLEYINLGFHILLHPTTPRLISPIHDDSSEDLGICVINTLFNEVKWQSLVDTKIQVNHRIKDLNEIQHDEDNVINFFKMKQEVAHILKCRYSALLKTIAVSLAAIQHLCQYEVNNLNQNNLITCLNVLRDTIPSVTTMLNSLFAIFALLKKASIGDYKIASPSCLKKVVDIASECNYIFLKAQNTSLIDEINALNGITFLENIRKDQLCITQLFSDTKINQFLKNNCVFDKPMLNKFELIKYYGIHHDLAYHKISSHLKQFCIDFVKTDYDLFFSKLIKQYIL